MILSFFFISLLPDMFKRDSTINSTRNLTRNSTEDSILADATDRGIRVTITTCQYHVAAIGIFITWIINMLMVGKIPTLGKYVQMLKTVGSNFFSFFVAYSSLVMAFALSFHVLFPAEESFGFFLTSFIKTIVMMTGELGYNSLYYPEELELNMTLADNASGIVHGEILQETRSMLFPLTPHLLLALFLALVSIVIMNLLFGIAVSDVQDIHKKSKLLQSIQQVDVIDHMENILKRPIFQKLPNNIKKFVMRKLSSLEGTYRHYEVEIDSYDKKKLLPPYLNTALKNLVLRYAPYPCTVKFLQEPLHESLSDIFFFRMQDRKRGQPTLHGLMKMQQRTDKKLEKVLGLLEQVARASGLRQRPPSPSPSTTSLELESTTLTRWDSTDLGVRLAVPTSPRISLTTAPNPLQLIREEE